MKLYEIDVLKENEKYIIREVYHDHSREVYETHCVKYSEAEALRTGRRQAAAMHVKFGGIKS